MEYLRSDYRSVCDVFANSFVAPSYLPYVVHLLKDAKSRQFRRLYFVSRDSYILQKIAEVLPHDGIEYRYLFISRVSLQDAFFYVATDEELNELGLARYKELEKDYSTSYGITMQYLQQEGVFDDRIALVDVGWFGRTRAMINCFRRIKGKENLFSYYYGIHEICLSKKYGAFDYYIKQPLHPEWSTYIIEEYFSRCPYPTTIGYYQDKELIVKPIFPKGTDYVESEIVRSIVEACVELSKKYLIHKWTDVELYQMMENAHNTLFHSNYVAKHKEMHAFFNDQCLSIYIFGWQDIKKFLHNEEFDYTINVQTNLRLALGDFGYFLITILKKLLLIVKTIKVR